VRSFLKWLWALYKSGWQYNSEWNLHKMMLVDGHNTKLVEIGISGKYPPDVLRVPQLTDVKWLNAGDLPTMPNVVEFYNQGSIPCGPVTLWLFMPKRKKPKEPS